MEIFLDCLPCMMRQVLEASRMVTNEPEVLEKIMGEAMVVLSEYKQYQCSPQMGRDMHQIVKRITGALDPYKEIKERDIQAAQSLMPFLTRYLKNKNDALYWALKIAGTGNVMDSALYKDLNLNHCIEQELSKEFARCDLKIFDEQLKTAKNILVIGDNAGETVFDGILLKKLKDYSLIYAVRNAPIINDATLKEAYESGLDTYSTLISTGCDAPGVILDEASPLFREYFEQADIVISKGQGNFEALSGSPRPVFFLLKAKCPMIAERLGISLNEYVFKYWV